jgi:porin
VLHSFFKSSLSLVLLFTLATAQAQESGQQDSLPVEAVELEEPAPSRWRDNLTGDWGGARSKLAERGMTLDLKYTGFYQGMLTGNDREKFQYGSRVDALLDFDTGKAGLWEGGSFHAHVEGKYGFPAQLGGALWPVNVGLGLPLPLGERGNWAASSLYLTQEFDDVSLTLGKVNVIDLLAGDPFFGGWGTQRFMNVAFVAPPSGVLPPTIMGAIVNYQAKPMTWTFMVYDPNDHTNDYSTTDLFNEGVNFSVGTTWRGEIAGRASSIGVTGLYSTKGTADLRDFLLPPELKTNIRNGSYNLQIQVSHLLLESESLPGKGLGLYGKAGVSDGNPNPFQSYFVGGVSGHGLSSKRPGDSFGLGYFYYNFSDALQDTTASVANFDNETGVEAFYNFEVMPGINLTTDLQWLDPANGNNSSFWAGGLRLNANF